MYDILYIVSHLTVETYGENKTYVLGIKLLFYFPGVYIIHVYYIRIKYIGMILA